METVDKNEGALNACVKKMIERSVVAEHAWEYHHPIYCEDTWCLPQCSVSLILVNIK